jgi:hypothetical protein
MAASLREGIMMQWLSGNLDVFHQRDAFDRWVQIVAIMPDEGNQRNADDGGQRGNDGAPPHPFPHGLLPMLVANRGQDPCRKSIWR